MSELVVVEDSDAGAVVRKVPHSNVDRHRLEHERELLVAAQHPGVVELVPDDDGEVLATRFVGPRSLETTAPLDLVRAAAVVATIADTLADLHGLGVVHCRVEPAHVVLDEAGRPVLCGFGGATYTGTVAPRSDPLPPELIDPAHGPGAVVDPSIDVFGLGAVLRLLVVDERAEPEPIPERRWSFAALRASWPGYRRRALLNLADAATADEPTRRPSMREFAAAVREIAPEPRLHHSTGDTTTAPPAGRAGTLAAAVLGIALLLVGLSSLIGGSPRSRAVTTASEAAPPPEGEASVPAPTTTAPSCPPVVGVPAFDLGADGCVDGATLAGDGIVSVGTEHFAVGSPGDVIAFGDWDCDGDTTPAVLRTSSGEVYEFESWATPDRDVTAILVGSAPGAVALRPSTDPCPRPEAVAADGSLVEMA